VDVVNDTVAAPVPLVVDVTVANEPPVPVFVHVTVLAAVATGFWLASINWAVTVTAAPATGLAVLSVTVYVVAGPDEVVRAADVPVNAALSNAVTVYATPADVDVVNETVATPPALVVDVGEAKEPPAPVLLHVTVLPDAATGLPNASASCALMATVAPAAGVIVLGATRYLVAAPTTVVNAGLVPVIAVLSVAVTA
jgi:hypothetical protein